MSDSAVDESIRIRIAELVAEPLDGEYYLRPVRQGAAESAMRFLWAMKLRERPAIFRTAGGKIRAEWTDTLSIHTITFRGEQKEAKTYSFYIPVDNT